MLYLLALKEMEDVCTAPGAVNTGEPTGLTVEKQV